MAYDDWAGLGPGYSMALRHAIRVVECQPARGSASEVWLTLMKAGYGSEVLRRATPVLLARISGTVPFGGVAMLKWLAGLWHRIDGWMHRRASSNVREFPAPYHRSNLHGRHR